MFSFYRVGITSDCFNRNPVDPSPPLPLTMFFGPSCGGSIYDGSSLLMEELYAVVVEEKKQINFMWLVDNYGLEYYDALKELTRFAEACPLKMHLSYMVSGVCKQMGHHYAIEAEDLYTTLDLFEEESRVVNVSKLYVLKGSPARQTPMMCDDDEGGMITDEDITPNHQQLFEQKRGRDDDFGSEYQLKRRQIQSPSFNHYSNFFAQKFQM